MDDFIGWVVGIVVVGLVGGFIYLLTNINDDPCRSSAVEFRTELIEAHERCMVEENCIYEDYDIRKYDRRVEQQEACRLND